MTELNEATFPKTGRVNEVCREWVVREDNALAQQLQSQEIHDHYRGNRYRNQVVRQDFPTALSEQIKEKEVADQQAALYHQMLNAQAEADAAVARKVAENLRREQEIERRRNIEQSEYLARQLEEDLVLQAKPPSASSSSSSSSSSRMQQSFPSPPEPIVNELPIPPKKLGTKFSSQRRNYNDNDIVTNPSYVTASPTHTATPLRDSPQLNYVSLELNIPKDSQKRLANHHATQYTQVFAHNLGTPPLSPSDSDSHHYEHINLHSHTPEKKTNPQPYVQRDYSFPPPPDSVALALPPKLPSKQSPTKNKQYDLPKLPPKAKDLSPTNRGLQMLTTDSFDILMGNPNLRELPDECDSLAIGGAEPKVARNTERVFNSNTPNINRIDSVDDILSYDGEEAAGSACSSDRIRQLKELGVPADEILEIDRRLTQQEKDEELARRLQEEEGQACMTQEEKDHMVAIEAQDKELARMLQEREKAKARRAKERARARKQQLQQEKMQQEAAEGAQYVENSSAVSHTRSHSDSNDIEHDSYSDPIDLINARENAKQLYQAGEYFHSKQSSGASRDSLFNDENYSNPVDSLRNAALNDSNHNASPPRPSKKVSSKQPRPKSNESIDNMEQIQQPNSSSSGPNSSIPTPSNESQNFLPAHLKYTTPDQNSNPIPPYMPIQGVRRNGNMQSDKKKKPKDNRCTHQ
ncbi:inner centromere protein A [Sitodiplosis mosellana]|uniref:inner centromere protein A n=1 Tax=Sitodiplosis mosellana TaxID=263140 RepID=UPI00244471F4|nr:inner centromere protein A [Sitodiplosis mosellana]